MKNLMTTNIYDVRGSIAVVGACLESVQPEGFRAATEGLDEVYSLCLEETHINMAVTKLGAMLSTGQIQKLVFVSVDRSPHCTQLHYIKHELKRMMTLNAEVLDYVVKDNKPILVSDEAIDMSKSLSKLAELY